MLWLSCIAVVVWSVSQVRRRRTRGEPLWLLVIAAVAGVAGTVVLRPPGIVLQKAIASAMMPIALLWWALIALWFLVRRPVARRYLGALILVYALLGNDWVGAGAVAFLEQPFRGIDPLSEVEGFDAVLVLGGGTSLTPGGSPQLSASGDRVRLGAALYHAGFTPVLVTSGSGIEGFSGARDLARETSSLWQELAVPSSAIVTLAGPRNTREEIAAIQKLIAQRHWRRVGLVTSAWHMRRALRLARRRGLRLAPLPADFVGTPPPISIARLVPTSGGFSQNQRAAWEVLGALVGR